MSRSKIVSFLIVFMMLFSSSAFAFAEVNAPSEGDSVVVNTESENSSIITGERGDSLKWEFNEETGDLKIMVEDEMPPFDMNPAPWKELDVVRVQIEGTPTNISRAAFLDCSKLKEITIPDSVMKIEPSAFGNCFLLESISFPNNIADVGAYAFNDCRSLKEIKIPEGIKKLESGTFMGCWSLKNVVLPNSITVIGSSAFEDCSNLETVNLPEGLTSIGDSAFEECVKLKEVIIPDSVNSIEMEAFAYCGNIELLSLPNNEKCKTNKYSFRGLNTEILIIPYKAPNITWVTAGKVYCYSRNYTIDFWIGTDGEIYGFKDSAVEQFAKKNAFKFVDIETVHQHTPVTDPAVEPTYTETGLTEGSHCSICGTVIKAQEVIPMKETFTVTFKDGFGNVLSTEKVPPGMGATAPAEPTHDLYLFDGWDKDFSKVSGNMEVNAKWKDNPNVIFDDYAHVGGSFYVTLSTGISYQSYVFTCKETANFTYELTGTGMRFENSGVRYTYDYKVTVKDAGRFLFYIDGLYGSNTLKYKVIVTDHNYEPIVIAPTCLDKGYTKQQCSLCDDYYIENYVDAVGHSAVIDNSVKPTCENTGLTEGKHCSVCNEVLVAQEEVSATGHNYVSEVTIEPTCSVEGLMTYTCQNDTTHTYTEPIAVIPHTWAEEFTLDVTAKENIDGSKSIHCTVCDAIDETSVVAIPAIGTTTLATTAYTFNNAVKSPAVKVKDATGKVLVKGVDYDVKYATGRKTVGTYKVTVAFKGNYEGTVTKEFKINPKGATNVKLAAGKKQFTVKWSKPNQTYRKQITGYEVRYGTTIAKMNKAKPVTVKGATAVSKTIKNLKSKQKYQIQVRTYKTVKGVKYYSAWSTKKVIKTK